MTGASTGTNRVGNPPLSNTRITAGMRCFRICDSASRKASTPNPRGHYANDKRADIRVSVSYGGFQVPVEVKKNTHRDLWRAMRDQLMARYTKAPETEGYGIYLVFWFGKEHTQPPPCGKRPADVEDLKERLERTLSADEGRKISVCVIDVSRPGA